MPSAPAKDASAEREVPDVVWLPVARSEQTLPDLGSEDAGTSTCTTTTIKQLLLRGYTQMLTMGRPPVDFAVTPPLLSAVTFTQLTTSTRSSFAW